MGKRTDGGDAFPAHADATNGMSLMDYFAGQALASFTATETAQSQLEVAIREAHSEKPEDDRRRIAREIIAKRSYDQAAAMLAERERRAGK